MMDPFNDFQGGGVTYVKNLLSEQSKSYNIIFLGSGKTEQTNGNIKFINITNHPGNYILFNLKIIFWLFTNKYKFDLVHVHRSYFAIPFRIRYPKTKIVCTLHGRTFDVFKDRFKFISEYLIFFLKIIEKLALKACDELVPVSAIVADSFKKKYPWFKYSFLAPSMISSGFKSDHSLRRKDIIFVGRLEKIKQIVKFADLWENYGSSEILNIVGDGDEKYKLKHFKKVKLLGKLSHLQTMKKIASSKYLVLCSYSEASPTVLKEALYSGTPFISTDVGDAKLISSDLKHCFVLKTLNKQFAITLSEKIHQNIDKKERLNMIKVAENFTSKYIFKTYKKIYNDLLLHS